MKRVAMIVLVWANFISALKSLPSDAISEESNKSTFPFSEIVEACPDMFDQPKDLYAYHPICDPVQLLTQTDHDELTQTLEEFSQETLIDLSVVLTTSLFNTDGSLTNITMDSSEEGNQPFVTPRENVSLLGGEGNVKYQSILILINIEDISMIASASNSLRKAISQLEDYVHLEYFYDDFHLVRDEIVGLLHFVIFDYSLSSRHLNEQTDQDAENTTNRINGKLIFWRHLDVEIIITFSLIVVVIFLTITVVLVIAKFAADFLNSNSNAHPRTFEPDPILARVKTRVDNPFECHECVICMEKYISFKERIGSDNQSLKVLSCGHSLDHSCWRLYKQANSTNKDNCPVCRQRLNSSSSSLSSSSISYSLPNYVSIPDSLENDNANLPYTNLNGHDVHSYSDEEQANFLHHHVSIPDTSENDDTNLPSTNLNRHDVHSYSDEEEANFVHHQSRYQDAWEDQMLANFRIARNQSSYGSTAIETVYGTNTRDHQNPLSPPLPRHPVYHHGSGLDSHSQQVQMFPMRNHGQYDNDIHHLPTMARPQTTFSRDESDQRRIRRERHNQMSTNNTSFTRQYRTASQRVQEYSRSRERRNQRTRNVARHVQDASSLIGLVVEPPRAELNQNNRASSGRRSRRTTYHDRTAASYSDYNGPSTSYVSEYFRTDLDQVNSARRDRRSRRNRNNDRSTSHHFETEFSLIRNELDPNPRHNRQNRYR